MANRRKQKRTAYRNNSQIIAMALIGSGLVILGGLTFFLLPKGSTAKSPGSEFSSTVPVAVDYPSPDLTLNDIKGTQRSLNDFQNQVILVNNWATWCPPCKAEMPDLQAYFSAHSDEGFTIVAISAADAETDVRSFAREYQLGFPIWLDPQNEALAVFRNQSLPNSYVIDREGVVRLAWTGGITRDILEEHVTPLLEEK